MDEGRELFEFVAQEARLLDERRWDEWLALFSEDGRYWVPLAGISQTDRDTHNSLADEDRLLLSLRIERLKNPRAHSEHPPTRCQHVLQQPAIVGQDPKAGTCELHTPFVYFESRGSRQLVLAGSYRHHLVRIAGQIRIRLKRVDLLDAGSALPAIQLFP
jgi:3-phenylpropionate/cinnamic acid dioxygenase small subunit